MNNFSYFPVLIEEVETNRLKVVTHATDLPVISPIRIRGTCLGESEADLIQFTIQHYENLNRPYACVPVEICRALAIPMNSPMKDAVGVIESLVKDGMFYKELFELWRGCIIKTLNTNKASQYQFCSEDILLPSDSSLEDVIDEINLAWEMYTRTLPGT